MQYIIVIVAMLLMGCNKKDGSVGISSLTVPGMCTAQVTDYSGAIIDSPRQTVTVAAIGDGIVAGDGESQPRRLISGSEIEIQLCKGASCQNAQPSVYTNLIAPNKVEFVEAYSAGFTNYKIRVTACL